MTPVDCLFALPLTIYRVPTHSVEAVAPCLDDTNASLSTQNRSICVCFLSEIQAELPSIAQIQTPKKPHLVYQGCLDKSVGNY